jgi:hypothetical protein
VVKLDGQLLKEAQGGHSSRYAPLPGIGDDCFADLNQCMTVEKAVFLNIEKPISGCPDDDARAKFARAVARHRSRFAFPDGFDEVVEPLRRRFRDKRGKEGPEGKLLGDVEEIRTRRSSATEWDAAVVDLELVFIVKPSSLPSFEGDDDAPITDELREWSKSERKIFDLSKKLESTGEPGDRNFLWQLLVKAWQQECGTDHRVRITDANAVSGAEYSIAMSWVEPKLDLDHLSDN